MSAAIVSSLLLGLVGSGHCLVMCGPLACAAGARGPSPLPYQIGRIATYGVLGAVAGAAGGAIAGSDSLSILRRAVAGLAGVVLLFAASRALGLGVGKDGSGFFGRIGRLAGSNAVPRGWKGALLLGAAWGLLPCGLLYSAVLAAMTASSAAEGLLAMIVFGLGTAPALLVAGVASRRVLPLLARPWARWSTALVLAGLAAAQLGRAAHPPSEERPCCAHHG